MGFFKEFTSGEVWNSINESLNGTNNGATRGATGKIGKAFSYDGVDDFVRVPDSAVTDFGETTSFTLMAFLNSTETGVHRQAIGTNWGPTASIELRKEPNDSGQFIIGDGDQVSATGTTNITTGEFFSLTGIRNSDANRTILYINGVLEANVSGGREILATTTVDWGIGCLVGTTNNCASGTFWPGYIDEVLMWSNSHTINEIERLSDISEDYLIGDEQKRLVITTFENINVTDTGFFGKIGSSIFRVIKGWFTDLDVSGMTNLTGTTYIKNASCSAGQVLTTDANGLVSCTNVTTIKSGVVSVTEDSPVTFNTSFANTPYCTVSLDLSGSGSATSGMAFFENAPNTTAIRINWQDTGGSHTGNVMWVCTDSGNS